MAQRQLASPSETESDAAIAASQKEFPTTPDEARQTFGSSVHVRPVAASWKRGRPTPSARTSNVTSPAEQNQLGPNCRRKALELAGPCRRGQPGSACRKQRINSIGARISGQLNA